MRVIHRKVRLGRNNVDTAATVNDASRLLSSSKGVSDFSIDIETNTLASSFEEGNYTFAISEKFKASWDTKAAAFKASILDALSTHYAFTDALDYVESLLTDPEHGPIDPKAVMRSEEMDSEIAGMLEMRIMQLYARSQYSAEDADRLFEYALMPEPENKKNLGKDYELGEDNITRWVRDLRDMRDKEKKERKSTKPNSPPPPAAQNNVAVKRSRRVKDSNAR